MRQIDARNTRFRLLGGFMFLLKATLGLFGIVLFSISLFGWYELIFWRYIPSWWLFIAILGAIFLVLGAIQYFVLTPVEFSFVSRQSYAHDNPYADDVRAIREFLEQKSKE